MIGVTSCLRQALVEVDDAVEVAVVGDGDRALAVGLGGEHHLLDARRAVEHRVLGVVVEVDEALSHQPDSSSFAT